MRSNIVKIQMISNGEFGYQSDNLNNIPNSERWDLVVANPIGDLRSYDDDWHLHRKFFADVRAFLNRAAGLCCRKNNRGSTADTFRPLLEAANLSIVFVAECRPQGNILRSDLLCRRRASR